MISSKFDKLIFPALLFHHNREDFTIQNLKFAGRACRWNCFWVWSKSQPFLK